MHQLMKLPISFQVMHATYQQFVLFLHLISLSGFIFLNFQNLTWMTLYQKC